MRFGRVSRSCVTVKVMNRMVNHVVYELFDVQLEHGSSKLGWAVRGMDEIV